MTIEFKDAPGNALLALDGKLTEEGLKRQAAGGIEFKVIEPSRVRAESAQGPQLGRINRLAREIQGSLDRMSPKAPVSGTHPNVASALKMLARLESERRATRGATTRN